MSILAPVVAYILLGQDWFRFRVDVKSYLSPTGQNKVGLSESEMRAVHDGLTGRVRSCRQPFKDLLSVLNGRQAL